MKESIETPEVTPEVTPVLEETSTAPVENISPEEAPLKPEDIPPEVAQLAEEPKCPKCGVLLIEENMRFEKRTREKTRFQGRNYYPVFAWCKLCGQDLGVAGAIRTKGGISRKNTLKSTSGLYGNTTELRKGKRRKANKTKKLNRKTNRRK